MQIIVINVSSYYPLLSAYLDWEEGGGNEVFVQEFFLF